MDHFLPLHQNFTQNWGFKKFSLKMLEFNDNIGYFDMFQGFKKVTPYGGAKKLRLSNPQCAVDELEKSDQHFMLF